MNYLGVLSGRVSNIATYKEAELVAGGCRQVHLQQDQEGINGLCSMSRTYSCLLFTPSVSKCQVLGDSGLPIIKLLTSGGSTRVLFGPSVFGNMS